MVTTNNKKKKVKARNNKENRKVLNSPRVEKVPLKEVYIKK
ncbi:5022_t:CDS:1, partial [Gigaspora margarita]